jgi:tRNA splicing ligase
MLLFLAIETAPVIVKLMSSKGPYDDLLEQHEHAVENHKIEQMSIRNQKTNEKLQVLVETGSTAVSEEIESNKELTKRIVKAESEIAQEMIAKWKADELEKIKSGKHVLNS